MNSKTIQILLVEDDPDDVLLAKEYLLESSFFTFEVTWESNVDRAKELVLNPALDICLVDYHLGAFTGLDLIRYAREKGLIIPIILLTGQGNFEIDLEAMHSGATDFLIKNELNAQLLERSIRYALSQAAALKELESKEKRYRSLFERSIDPIFLADENFNFIDANEAMLQLFKCELNELLKLNVKDLFTTDEIFSEFKTHLNKIEIVKNFETPLKTCREKQIDCLINCVFIPDNSPMPCCYQGIIHDLTLRNKTEKELVRAEKEAMTGQMARTIAHEVRNPLTNLNLALEQLSEELEESETVRLYTSIISRNANRIEQLISELLNSSKPLKELNLSLMALPQVVQDALALVRDRINLNKMKLLCDIPQDIPRVYIDGEKIKVALLNIFVNAVEAMEAGKGVLSVSASQADASSVELVVADNGQGIPADKIDKLFDPFHTGKPGGMGLGLTASHNILKSHQIDLDVSSHVGEGATFKMVFKVPH